MSFPNPRFDLMLVTVENEKGDLVSASFRGKTINICQKCGNRWKPRKTRTLIGHTRVCPKCKRYDWEAAK